jgi:hypothetical protein
MGSLIFMAIMAIVMIATTVTMAVLVQGPDLEDLKPSGLGDYNFPTNLESRYLPVVWGTTLIKSPNVIWYGDLSTYPLTTGGQIIGYRYSLGVDLGLCYGPLDSISEIQIDDMYVIRPGEQGTLTSGITPAGGWQRPMTGERKLSFSDLNFFGGDKSGGRLIGSMTLYYGTENQRPSTYIQGQEASNTLEVSTGVFVPQSEIVPSYAGMAHAVWEGGELSERAVIPAISFTVHRYPTQLSAAYSIVNNDGNGIGDANPIHCIYEILTDSVWGCGVPEDLIDSESFYEAAKSCHAEGNGFGYTLDSTKSASSVLEVINDQVNGVLSQNEEGLWSYTLLRRTYDKDTKYVLDYDKMVKSNTRVLETSGTATAGGYVLDFAASHDLSAYVIGEPVYVKNTTSGFEGCFLIEAVDDGDDRLTFTPLESQDYTGFMGLAEQYEVYRLTGYETIPELTESDILKVKSADRQSWAETFNVVQVKYLDRTDYFKETIATSHDLGNFAIVNGVQTTKKYDLQGVRTPASAARVAQRLLRAISYPITTLAIDVPRRFYRLRPGDMIHVSHPDFGLEDFYFRILEVGLPNDRGASITLKGTRDTFDEPLDAEVVHIGGEQELSTTLLTLPSAPNSDVTLASGAPLFFHQRDGLGANYKRWWIIGRPDGNTTYGVGRNILSDGTTYVDATPILGLPPTGKIRAHADRLWDDVDGITQLWYGKNNLEHIYGPEAGPIASPTRADSNTGSTWDASLAKNDTGSYLYGPSGEYLNRQMGDLIVADLTTSMEALVAEYTQVAIQELGYGLAYVRPNWVTRGAHGASSRPVFDEIIAYERAEMFTLYYGYDRRVISTLGGGRNPVYGDVYSIQFTPQDTVLESRTGINLFGVHRGLLDTGIQQINHDSDIIFIAQTDQIYDEVASTSGVLVGFAQTMSAGGKLDMASAVAVSTSTAELQRRSNTLGVKNISLGGLSFNETWGDMYYDNGEWQAMNFFAWGSGNQTVTWEYENSTTVEGVNLYTETDSVTPNTTDHCRFIFSLLEDNNNSASQTERLAHARAYWKEGIMPTYSPVNSHPDFGGTGTERTTFRKQVARTSNGVTDTFNLSTLMTSGGVSLTLSSGELYYVEVLMQSVSNGAGANMSYGAQRFIVSFVAP